MKAEVLVRVRDEDPEVQIERQELTRAKSPMELSQISSPADFPIPENIENFLNKNKRGKAKLFQQFTHCATVQKYEQGKIGLQFIDIWC